MEDNIPHKEEERPQTSPPLEVQLAACAQERDEYLNGWKRAKADLANYRKEEMERFDAFAKLSTSALVSELLSLFDSFDLGLAAAKGDEEAKRGFYLIRGQLEDILKRRGLETILAPPGAPFDPVRHEGVGEMTSEYPPGTVAEEVSRGYMFHGRVLRPARVKISKEQKDNGDK
ncbi:MAG: nucleotide exchange factor GrpE [Candidatus Jorgensenbacteria bacterium]